jgi:hypothetical protein
VDLSSKQDDLVDIATASAQRLVTGKDKLRGLIGGNNVTVPLDSSQTPLQDLVVNLTSDLTGITVDGKAVGATLDSHGELLAYGGSAASAKLTDAT